MIISSLILCGVCGTDYTAGWDCCPECDMPNQLRQQAQTYRKEAAQLVAKAEQLEERATLWQWHGNKHES